MPDELKSFTPPILGMVSDVQPQSVQQHGEKSAFASRVDNMNITIHPPSPMLLQPSTNTAISVNADTTHYNLFVFDEIDLQTFTPFIFPADRALTEHMGDGVDAGFAALDEAAIARIKRIPTLFSNENTYYGRAGEDQVVGLGFVKQIKVRREGVKIYPDIRYLIPQQKLNEALFELDLRGSNSMNEFNRTHWCIKKIDLIAELRELGFNI